ncbi:carbohydrate ABC transporter permease [Mesorhizobium australicum]|uniref:Carbohydrate ABC transporter membrane protein 1, CUT1 family n=1 Tax=Mesorhizobium australicum TaxID=536018 RepID=A0A1X7PPM1_9HYPH|nr:sugar ABC transporter permease [Mesorhizobium australicum]SMH53698.1 carbohydrate ABC transporter membrane protein 1, CUT1 family [Mesorhizobium australicum]
MISSRWTPYLFLAPALAGLLIFRLTPIGVALGGSLTGVSLMGDLRYVGLENFEYLLTDPEFWSSLQITLLFNIIINPLQLAVAFALALLVFRPLPGLWLYRTLLVLPMAVSTGISAVLFGLFLDGNLGPMNGFLEWIGIGAQPFHRSQEQALYTLIGIATWKGAGYWMLFLLAGLYSIPSTVHEAATIDGASGWQRFRYVTLPLMRKPMAFVLVADTAINFLFFAPVYILTSGGPSGSTSVLMFQAYRAAFTFSDIGRSLAISTILLGIILLIVVLEFRLMRSPEERT